MRYRKLGMTLIEVLVVLVLFFLLIGLLLPFYRSAPEAARRNTCMNNLKQIGLAVLEYESKHGTLPPAYTVDEEGNRLHSWRTLILPYMEEQKLYEGIDLAKPWDDPANAKARETVVDVYYCPSADHEPGLTTYFSIVGPDCVFSGSTPRKLSELTDGVENTLMIVDVQYSSAVHWMSPHDTTPTEILNLDPKTRTSHPGGRMAMFADAHPVFLYIDIDKESLRKMLTIAGGEEFGDF